jgi:hypothetical protein
MPIEIAVFLCSIFIGTFWAIYLDSGLSSKNMPKDK